MDKKTKLHEKAFLLACNCIRTNEWLKDVLKSDEDLNYKVSCIDMVFSTLDEAY